MNLRKILVIKYFKKDKIKSTASRVDACTEL